MNCTFCRVLAGELPSSKILERDTVVAFLDVHPINQGHTLIVPRRHVESFTELTPTESAEILEAAKVVGVHLKSALTGAEGVTLSLADGAVAGQEVPHAHLHVIPRRVGAGFGWKFPEGYGEKSPRETLDGVAKLIRNSIDGNKTS
jgi:histidine triad (HIT) family protein